MAINPAALHDVIEAELHTAMEHEMETVSQTMHQEVKEAVEEALAESKGFDLRANVNTYMGITAVIMYWRGMDGLMELAFEDSLEGYLACVAFGLSIMLLIRFLKLPVAEVEMLPPAELLEEICVRFILTLPAVELESFDRLLFSIEQAWWHYEDYVREKPEHRHLRSLTLKEFTGLIFERVPGLQPFKASLEEIYASFNKYKRTVPVRGAILLDPSMEKCLLVKGWKRDAGWGFPRGKISANEPDLQCAVREVLEETGVDIGALVREEDFIAAKIGDQDTKLFIVQGIPESTHFAPHVKYEIGEYAWYRVAELPASWEDSKAQFVSEEGRHRFYNVWPYIKPLKAWIFRRARGGQQKQQQKGQTALAVGGSSRSASAAPLASSSSSERPQQPQQQQPEKQQTRSKGSKAGGKGVLQPQQPQQQLPVSRALLAFRFDREAIMRHLQLGRAGAAY
eukprot:scaffold16.g12.t1